VIRRGEKDPRARKSGLSEWRRRRTSSQYKEVYGGAAWKMKKEKKDFATCCLLTESNIENYHSRQKADTRTIPWITKEGDSKWGIINYRSVESASESESREQSPSARDPRYARSSIADSLT
jgi:hypothetical protein